MKTKLLFPSFFKVPGLLLFLVGLGLFTAWSKFGLEFRWLKLPDSNGSLSSLANSSDNYTFSLALSLVLLGLVFLGFSKLKLEDEMIAAIRLRSLQMSIYITVFSFLFVTMFTFSFAFLTYAMWLWYGFLFLYCAIFYSKIILLKSAKNNDE